MPNKCAICGDEDGDTHNVVDNGEPPVLRQPLHRFTTTKPKFWTADDVVEWIKANVPDKDAPDGSEAAALWWKACRDSELIDDMNSRERAEMFLDGVQATSLDHITEDIQNRYEDEGYTVEEMDEQWEEALRDFFHTLKGERG